MGVDYTVYVGPYAECEYESMKYEERYNGCSNPGCLNNRRRRALSDNFCPICGSKIKEQTYIREGEPELPDELFDVFTWILHESENVPKNTHFWTPNLLESGFKYHRLDPTYEFGIYPYLKDELEKAAEYFARLTPYYARVTVKYGIIIDAG